MNEQTVLCATCGQNYMSANGMIVVCTNFCPTFFHGNWGGCVYSFIKSKIGTLKIIENGGPGSLDVVGLGSLTLQLKCDCGAPYYKCRWNSNGCDLHVSEWEDFNNWFRYHIKQVIKKTMDDVVNKVIQRAPYFAGNPYVDSAINSLKKINLAFLERIYEFAVTKKVVPIELRRRLPMTIRNFAPLTSNSSDFVIKIGYLIDIKKNRIIIAKRIREFVRPEIGKYVMEYR